MRYVVRSHVQHRRDAWAKEAAAPKLGFSRDLCLHIIAELDKELAMTSEEKDKIRAAVREQWRLRLAEEEQSKMDDFDPVALGMRVAKAMDDYAEEIDQDVADEISATEMRRGDQP